MLRNIGSNWVLILLTIAVTYVLTPFIIDTLGTEGYGTWTLITSMTGYISLMALGVPMACVRYLAQDVAEGNARKINQTIGSCAGLYLLIGDRRRVDWRGADGGVQFLRDPLHVRDRGPARVRPDGDQRLGGFHRAPSRRHPVRAPRLRAAQSGPDGRSPPPVGPHGRPAEARSLARDAGGGPGCLSRLRLLGHRCS